MCFVYTWSLYSTGTAGRHVGGTIVSGFPGGCFVVNLLNKWKASCPGVMWVALQHCMAMRGRPIKSLALCAIGSLGVSRSVAELKRKGSDICYSSVRWVKESGTTKILGLLHYGEMKAVSIFLY